MLRDFQYYKFCAYGFLKNLRFFEIFFILYLKQTGLDYLSIGLLYSIRQITINLLEVPSGIVADSWSRKRALLISISAYLMAFVLFFIGTSFLLLAAAMILYGAGEAFRSGTHKAIILRYLKNKKMLHLKTRYYGSTRSWSQLGSALVSLLAAAFHFLGATYQLLFLITLIPYILEWLLIASYPTDVLPRAQRLQIGPGKRFQATLRDFTALFKSPAAMRAMFSSAAYTAFFKTIKDYLQPLLMVLVTLDFLNSDPDAQKAVLFGLVYFILYLLTATVSRNTWRLEKRAPNIPRLLNWLYLVGTVSVGLAGILLAGSVPVVGVLCFVFLYLIQNARRPLMVTYLSDIIKGQIMASGLSAVSQLETVLIAVFAPIVGFLIDNLGLGLGLAAGSLLFIAGYPLLKLGAVERR